MLSPSGPRLLLIEDHSLVRTGLRMVLQSVLRGAIILEAASIAEAVRCSGGPPDVVLLDIDLPGLSGLEGLAVLRRQWPASPVIVVTAHDGEEACATALLRGAVAFLHKSESSERMRAVIEAVLLGETVTQVTAADAAARPSLTARQCEVLDQLRHGYSNKIIARKLSLSEHTVRGHVAGLLAALGATSRTEAIAIARSRGLVR